MTHILLLDDQQALGQKLGAAGLADLGLDQAEGCRHGQGAARQQGCHQLPKAAPHHGDVNHHVLCKLQHLSKAMKEIENC